MVKSQLLNTTSRSRRFRNLQHYYSHCFGFFINSVKSILHLVLYHDRIQAVMRHFVESRPRDLRLCCDLQHRDLKSFAGVRPLENRRQKWRFKPVVLGFTSASAFFADLLVASALTDEFDWDSYQQKTRIHCNGYRCFFISQSFILALVKFDFCTTSKRLGPPFITHRFLLFHCHSLVLTYWRCSCRRRLETKIVELIY